MTSAIPQETLVELNQQLGQAKIALMLSKDSAFFTTLVFSLTHEFSMDHPTATTNGRRIKYGVDFFKSLTKEERVFLMLHEAMHVAYLHVDPFRRQARDGKRWNIAADHVINLQLLERGFKMPSVGIADPRYKDMSVEQVYDLLAEQEQKGGKGAPDTVPGFGDDLEEPGSPMEAEELQSDVKDILVRAAMQSQMAGNTPGSIPGDIQVFLDKLLNPILPWQRILQKYLGAFNKNDYSFRKPNRRFFPKQYLPRLYSEALGEVAIAVDISGSVSDSDFAHFISETSSILKMMKPKLIRFIQFDTQIHSEHRVKSLAELMKIEFRGRGGTDVTPVIEWANKNKPQVILVFTDGEFCTPSNKTDVDVVWMIHNNKNFTSPNGMGKTIHYEMPSNQK